MTDEQLYIVDSFATDYAFSNHERKIVKILVDKVLSAPSKVEAVGEWRERMIYNHYFVNGKECGKTYRTSDGRRSGKCGEDYVGIIFDTEPEARSAVESAFNEWLNGITSNPVTNPDINPAIVRG